MPRAALVSGGAEVEVRLAFPRNMDLMFFTVIMIRFMHIHLSSLSYKNSKEVSLDGNVGGR